MDHFIKLYKKKKGKDIRKDNRAVQKLRREVEKAKRALSSQHQVRVEVESLFDGEDFSEQLTRAKFEELNMVSWSLFVVSGWMQRTNYDQICLPTPSSQFCVALSGEGKINLMLFSLPFFAFLKWLWDTFFHCCNFFLYIYI